MKWIVGILVVAGIVATALWGLARYANLHATDPNSFASGTYERRIKGDLLKQCRAFIKNYPSAEDNTPEQYEALCNCFANDIFERFRNVPPDKFAAEVQKAEATESAQNIVEKCIYQSGVN